MLSRRFVCGEEVPGGMTVTGGAHDSLAGADVAGPDVLVLRAAADIELLRLVRAGHDDAFAELFARHASAVSLASPGRNTINPGIARRLASCSTGW